MLQNSMFDGIFDCLGAHFPHGRNVAAAANFVAADFLVFALS